MASAQAVRLLPGACEVVSLDEVAAQPGRRALRPAVEPDTFEAPAPLRCVSSGYLAEGHSCRASVPVAVANAAWWQEQARHPREDRMFQFDYEGEQWLGFGLADGRVRGVYCPEHNARRSEHYYRPHVGPRPQLRVVGD